MAITQNTPLFHADDVNGAALAGGQLFVYQAGTLTPVTVYSDAALTVPTTNPIILDEFGNALIYIAPGSYKFNLLDVNNVQQADWPVDNYTVTNDVSSVTLADTTSASNGAGLVGYNSALSYAGNTIGAGLNALTTQVSALAGSLPPAGSLLNVQIFTSGTGTYTPTSGTKTIIVDMVGGGGGGGGCVATGSSQFSITSGGGSAGYARIKIANPTTYGYTVGNGGNGGSGGVGSAGTTTSFASCTVGAGSGGTTIGPGTIASLFPTYPSAQSGSNNLSGCTVITSIRGCGANLPLAASSTAMFPSSGANTPGGFGLGGVYPGGAAQTGQSGFGYGSGGSGSFLLPSTSATTGGAGASGIIIVYEYS